MAKVIDIEGIGATYAKALGDAGIDTTEELLEAAGSASGRQKLAEKLGVSGAKVLEWVNRADLFRVKGIGSEFSDLLEAAGVDSVPELAQRNPANLHAKLVEVNAAKRLVRQLPSASQVEAMVEHAKTLERKVTHG